MIDSSGRASRWLLVAVAGGVLSGLASCAALAAGDPLSGEGIAARWCANCHATATGAPLRGTDGAPPFSTILAKPGSTDAWLRGVLRAPHQNMPDLQLERRELEDLIAYLGSLR